MSPSRGCARRGAATAAKGQGPERGGAGGVGRTAATMLEALMQEQGTPGQGRGADRDDLRSGDR